jgi:Mce-associated membrane protein
MRRRTLTTVLVTLPLLVGAAASVARQPDNLAFVDLASTRSAADQGGGALAAVLSYDYRKLDDTIALAKQKGTDAYLAQHTDELNKARATATKQRQVVASKVAGVGVRDLRAETAKLVVFLDQTVTRGDTNRTSTVGLTYVVDLRLVGGEWKLDNVASTAP